MKSKNILKSRALIIESLTLLQSMNDLHSKEIKRHLFKAVEQIDAKTKNENKMKIKENVNNIVAKKANQPVANKTGTATVKTLEMLNNMIKEQEKKLNKLQLSSDNLELLND